MERKLYELHNEHNPQNDTVANSLPYSSSDNPEPNILKEEIKSAIQKLSEDKAPGFDTVTSEEIKAAGETGTDIFHYLCNQIWESEKFPKEWGRAVITPIYKKKDKLDCGNYRGINLLSHAGRVLTIILTKENSQKNRINPL